MMFYVWRNMFMVWMSAGERWIVGMLKRIIPTNLLAAIINLIAIIPDPLRVEIDQLPYIQDDVIMKGNLPFRVSRGSRRWALTLTLNEIPADIDQLSN